MANPTTNFGWVLPTNTDLVKDLPADFEVALQGVDTAFADLNGGTTGQVLKKNSNTNLDFVWGADGIANTIMDAKGDLIAATADDTPARLAIGSNGQVLTADSAQSTGMKWATPAGGGGKILQVVQEVTVAEITNSSTAAFTSIVSKAITPAAATSKILVYVQNSLLEQTKGAASIRGTYLKIKRGATDILDTEVTNVYDADGSMPISYFYIDSPNTTSSTTYEYLIRIRNSGAGALATAKAGTSITLLEIGA